MKRMTWPLVTLLFSVSLVGCAQSKPENPEQQAAAKKIVAPTDNTLSMEQQIAVIKKDMTADSSLPIMTVYKSPTCGCCKLWVDHIEKSGFKVSVIETEEMNPIKLKLGVPAGLGSCHTAKVGGYFVEGHVPANDVKRLLKEKPDALGISVPGMPMGSPGMEVPSGETQPYNVTIINKDGSLSIFSSH